MALSTGRAKLYDALKVLRLRWEEVQHYWNDPVSREFDENVWKRLDPQTQSALRAIDRLDQQLIQFRQDCS